MVGRWRREVIHAELRIERLPEEGRIASGVVQLDRLVPVKIERRIGVVYGNLERALVTGVSLGCVAPPANPDSFIDDAVYRHVTGKVLVIYPRDLFKLTPEIISGKAQLDGAKNFAIIEVLITGNRSAEDQKRGHEKRQDPHLKESGTAFKKRMSHLLHNLLRKEPHEHWPCTNCNDRIERIHRGTLLPPPVVPSLRNLEPELS